MGQAEKTDNWDARGIPRLNHYHPEPNLCGQIGLRYFDPPQHLASYFGPSYLFTAVRPDFSDFIRADFAQLRFLLSGGGTYRFSNGHVMRVSPISLMGPTLGATHFEAEGPVQLLGVNVMPLGWLLLTDLDASDLADSLIDLSLAEPKYHTLLHHFCLQERPEDAVNLLWRALETKLKPLPEATHRFVNIVNCWLYNEQDPSLPSLAQRTNLSSRQVSRLCKRLFGCSPKYLARKYRALRFTVQMALDGIGWRDKVGDIFYDQSHLIREVKHFTGMTPNQLRDSPTLMHRLQLAKREFDERLIRQNPAVVAEAKADKA